MSEMIQQLERVRSKAWCLLVTQRIARLVSVVLLVLLLLTFLDFGLRLPPLFRAVLLSAGIVAVAMVCVRWITPALRFKPSLTRIALRMESMQPQLDGRLASSVDFVMSGAATRDVLAGRAVRETTRRFEAAEVGSVIRYRPAIGDGVLALLSVILIGVLVFGMPSLAAIGAKRMLLPFSDAIWPPRTAVASLMDEVLLPGSVHPRGQVLSLRARNLTSGGYAERVEAHYRVISDDVSDAWKRVILTHQVDDVHERLIDVDGEVVELYFTTEDARTPVERVRLEFPPTVVRARLAVTPPAYAESYVAPREVELGPGTDGRARYRDPLLVGSTVRLHMSLNKPLPLPAEANLRRDALAAMLGLHAVDVEGMVLESGASDIDQLTIEHTLTGPFRQPVHLLDAYGLRNPDPIEFVLETAADQQPSVTLLEPQRDETVLVAATVPLAAEATDDVAVETIGFQVRIQRSGTADVVNVSSLPMREVHAQTVDLAGKLELRSLDLNPGDIVLVAATATDGWRDEAGNPRPPSVSAERRLQVISELDMAGQIRRELGSVRQNAMRIESLQSELQERMIGVDGQPVASVDVSAVARSQVQIVERIAAQRERVDELLGRAARNQMADEQIDELLRQSRDLLDFSGRAAAGAVTAAEQLARGDEPIDEERARSVLERQREVRDELLDLIALLDRDEDSWIVQRQLEALLERQQAISRGTTEAEARTLGADEAALDGGEREELDRLAQEQRALREAVRRLSEEMERRARALGEVDQEAGEAMRRAVRTAEQRSLDREMERAAEQIERNQLRNAGASQENVREALERMLEELSDTGRNRAEELLRRLASLKQVIERLVVSQENELAALAEAEVIDDFAGRDRAMIRLNQNTRSATDEARASQQTRRIARRLQQAADMQTESVIALRRTPIDLGVAREAQERSLQLLMEALALAEELEEETEEDLARQQRDALIAAYRELAERQVSIRMQTQQIVGAEESRRQLMEARRLAVDQDELRRELSDLSSGNPELMDSEVFGLIHELMDTWSREVSESLREGRARRRETDRQRLIAESIYRQIAAIEEASAPPPDFVADGQNEEGGAGGGGSGSGGILPPAAELQRLLGLQIQVRDETRRVHEERDLPDGDFDARTRELGMLQMEILRIAEQMAERFAQPSVTPMEGP